MNYAPRQRLRQWHSGHSTQPSVRCRNHQWRTGGHRGGFALVSVMMRGRHNGGHLRFAPRPNCWAAPRPNCWAGRRLVCLPVHVTSIPRRNAFGGRVTVPVQQASPSRTPAWAAESAPTFPLRPRPSPADLRTSFKSSNQVCLPQCRLTINCKFFMMASIEGIY